MIHLLTSSVSRRVRAVVAAAALGLTFGAALVAPSSATADDYDPSAQVTAYDGGSCPGGNCGNGQCPGCSGGDCENCPGCPNGQCPGNGGSGSTDATPSPALPIPSQPGADMPGAGAPGAVPSTDPTDGPREPVQPNPGVGVPGGGMPGMGGLGGILQMIMRLFGGLFGG